jgi:hypothetical protein
VKVLPTMVVIDRNGVVRAYIEGTCFQDCVQDAVREAQYGSPIGSKNTSTTLRSTIRRWGERPVCPHIQE